MGPVVSTPWTISRSYANSEAMPLADAGIGSIRLGSLFMTLPTCAWAGHHASDRRSGAFWSFDHLVGAGEDVSRDLDAKRAGYFEVDHQLELGRLPGRRDAR